MGAIHFPVGDTPQTKSVISITSYQAKAALVDAGLFELVEAVISDSNTPARITLAWREGLPFRRDNPMIAWFANKLVWSEQQVDELFAAASLIEAGAL